VRELAVEDLTARLEALTGRTGLRDAVAITQEKISTLDEFWPLARAFFDEPVDDAAAREKFIAPELGADALTVARSALSELDDPWSVEAVEQALRQAVERSGMKAKQLFQPVRVALTGTTISPGIFETVALVGRDKALERIDSALDGRRGA
jgi:glutamyl/glutaminyl-tRNA synthetase